MQELGALRYEPTESGSAGILGGETVVDSVRAMLVWEPKRVVPTYAVPVEGVLGEIDAAPVAGKDEPPGSRRSGCRSWAIAPCWPPEVTGAIAFFNEVVDIVVDGVRVERPVTPWSRR